MKFLQMKFLSNGIVGGFYFSSRFPPWMKYTWIFANFMIILILLVLGNVGYLMSPTTKHFRDIVFAVLMTNFIILTLILSSILTYYYKNEIEEVLTLNEETFFKNIQTDSVDIEKSKEKGIRLLLLQVLCISSYFSTPLLCFVFSEEPNSLNIFEYYLNANIWLGHVQKPSQYYLIFLLQLIPLTLFILIESTLPIHVFLLGHELNTGFSKLRNFLKDISRISCQNIEQIYENAIHQEELLGSQKQDFDAVEYHKQQLVNNVVTAIRVHQGLQRYV